MENEEIITLISDRVVLLSEDNSDSVDAKFIICDFSPNGNNVSLNKDTIDNWINSLLNKPVVGKVVSNYNGKDDFSGHNVKIIEEVDENGNKLKTIEFDTQAFGSFYNVQVETINEIEYITATAKIWKRFKKAYAVFKSRVDSKKGLKTSWEVSVSESHNEKIKSKNVKVIDSGTFIGHCLLGESVAPAYKSSGVISVSTIEYDDEFTEAFSQDLLTLSEVISDDNDIDKDNIDTKSNKINIDLSEGGKKQVGNENEDTKTSALTENDVYRKVRKAINNASSDKYYYLSMMFPYDYKAIAYNWDREKDSDFVEFTYSVNSDDTVSITSQKEVEMIFSPKATVDAQVSELQGKLNEAEKEIAEAGKLLTVVSTEKSELETQVAELLPFKEKVEVMEQAEQERILSEKKEDLKTFTLEDDLISSEELESDEKLVQIFAELTIEGYESAQEKIEVIKGRKAIAKFKEGKEFSSKPEVDESKDLETSEAQGSKKPMTDLNNSDSDAIMVSATDIVKSFINKNKN